MCSGNDWAAQAEHCAPRQAASFMHRTQTSQQFCNKEIQEMMQVSETSWKVKYSLETR